MKTVALLPALFFLGMPIMAQQPDSTGRAILSDSSRPAELSQVIVTGKKPFVQLLPDKTIVNVDAAVTNTGATLLEVLQKSPGITMDRNGNISLKGRQGVIIMIDGKPANISGSDLNNLLEGMAASQVDQIEIIDNPSSKFDASGNAGIINIKTKKNRQAGFNGNVNLSFVQGRYSRTLNSLNLNFNSGKLNWFLNLSANYNQSYSTLDAFRRYYAEDNRTLLSMLEQPSYFKSQAPSQTIKTGVDFALDKKTTLGFVASAFGYNRKSTGNNTAFWLDKDGNTDSSIVTKINNSDRLRNFMINVNVRHAFSASSEITADFDILKYNIRNTQFYNNRLQETGGYNEDITGEVPSHIDIITGKADYTNRLKQELEFSAGWKSSYIKTNNSADYFLTTGSTVVPDYDKTNHFIYNEEIHALYANMQKKWSRWVVQGGLRYENTSYDANQLGNAQRKDSSFSRRYDGLFPSVTTSFEIDSNHSFTFTAGRRIDRPPFQSLNPFVFVINKYTYESGNPFYRPQYTWNFELSHTFRNMIVTSISYSRTKDYFSQIFTQDSTGIITYTVGNLDRMENYGLSLSFQHALTRWWSLTAFTALNYKSINGFVWNNRKTERLQANFNFNNQLHFGRGWSGELSWIWQLHEQELQEITDPSGQVGLGVAKQILKNKGTLKLAFRDILHTQWMKGFTVFEQSTEYFKILRDSRVVSLSFVYRFGKTTKSSSPKTQGGAEEEMQRVGEN